MAGAALDRADQFWTGRTNFGYQNWSGRTNFTRTDFCVTEHINLVLVASYTYAFVVPAQQLVTL